MKDSLAFEFGQAVIRKQFIPVLDSIGKVLAEIDAKVKVAMTDFYEHVKSGKELAGKAGAILVFPEVVEAGFGIGGEYGEGKLRG